MIRQSDSLCQGQGFVGIKLLILVSAYVGCWRVTPRARQGGVIGHRLVGPVGLSLVNRHDLVAGTF